MAYRVKQCIKVGYMNKFEAMGIDEDFIPFFNELKIKSPTKIQDKVIPQMMNEKSLLCVAQTGTGKTLAYSLPIIEMIKRHEDEFGPSRKRSKPMAIIVAPTKELAMQIYHVQKQISHYLKIRIRTLVGEKSKLTDLKSSSYEVLIATPHKLAQAVKKSQVFVDELKYLIFDEADQLFDMGFKNDLNKVVHYVDFLKTSVSFFSATMDYEVENFLDYKFKRLNLLKIYDKEAQTLQKKIETFNISLAPHEKLAVLKMFLQRDAKGRGIVFINQKNQVEEVENYIKDQLPKLKYKVLHGALSQKERLSNHKAFMDQKAQVLFATDVMARGIDVKDLNWVVNFGLPKTAIYYLHRAGRVARGGREGVVYNFVTPFDTKVVSMINELIKSQKSLSIDLIKESKKQPKAKKKQPKASKRVKQTKRNRLKR